MVQLEDFTLIAAQNHGDPFICQSWFSPTL
jgi:hypothetical protein